MRHKKAAPVFAATQLHYLSTDDMSEQLFDEFGRLIPAGGEHPVNQISRRYFLIDSVAPDLKEMYDRQVRHLVCGEGGDEAGSDVSFEEFSQRIDALKTSIENDPKHANLLNGVYVPLLLPALGPVDDLGALMSERCIEAVAAAYHEVLPDYDFVNQCPDKLNGLVSVVPGSRHQALMSALVQAPAVALYFPCLTEYSVSAAISAIDVLPENYSLTGGIDLAAAFVARPDLLLRENGYPPTLWASALRAEKVNTGYHFEAYGYNLNFYRRAHLGQHAEYWWHGLTVLG